MNHPIRFRCPRCDARIKASRQLIGQSRDCPGCGGRFVVRPPMPQDSDPHLVPGDWAAGRGPGGL